MTIPNRTSRVHLKPYWLGDSPHAFTVAARRRVGKRFTDTNFQACRDGEVALHWGTARRNGYRYITTGVRRRRRPMTKKELNRPIGQWWLKDVKRWRRTARVGKSYESRIRPFSWIEMLRKSKRKKVVMCPELKSRAFATEPERAQRMYRQMQQVGWLAYPMTLITMWGWGPKMKNFHEAGFETALIDGRKGHKRPADKRWDAYVDRWWI